MLDGYVMRGLWTYLHLQQGPDSSSILGLTHGRRETIPDEDQGSGLSFKTVVYRLLHEAHPVAGYARDVIVP